MANTLHHGEFSPGRDSRYLRDTADDDIQNPDTSPPGGSMFRPDRHNSFNIIQDDDDVVVPRDGEDPKSQANVNVPDAPTEPVPEPGTMLLMAPAVLGLWKKFRR